MPMRTKIVAFMGTAKVCGSRDSACAVTGGYEESMECFALLKVLDLTFLRVDYSISLQRII